MYSFVDTDTVPVANALPAEAMSVNGTYIENEIAGYRTLQVEGRELLESEISEMQMGFRDGSYYQQKRDVSRPLTITYQLLANDAEEFREKFNKLCQILDQEQMQIIFADEQDKFYTGTKSSVSQPEPGRLNVVSSFVIYCSDPYKYAVTEKTASNNNATSVALENNGTKVIPISVKATMKSDNGYLGLTLGDRFYQVGDPGEVDEVEKEKSEKLFDTHFTSADGWLLNQGITPPVTAERLQTGTVTYVTEDEESDEGYVKVADYKTGDSWHGAALTKIVPQDSQGEYPVNWRSEWRFDMNTDGGQNKGSQIGHNSVTFSDENDEIICAVVFEDNNPVYERSDMAVYIDGSRVWDTRETTSFYVTGRGGNGPVVIVEKLGNQITVSFSYGGIKKTFLSSKPDAQLRKVTWYCAAYKSYAPITNNNIRALNVTKHNVQYFEDIPNFLSEGDVVELDGPKNELYINDIKDWDRVDIGSRPLLLPPGQHTLGIIVSEWAETPEVEVTYQERWL